MGREGEWGERRGRTGRYRRKNTGTIGKEDGREEKRVELPYRRVRKKGMKN